MTYLLMFLLYNWQVFLFDFTRPISTVTFCCTATINLMRHIIICGTAAGIDHVILTQLATLTSLDIFISLFNYYTHCSFLSIIQYLKRQIMILIQTFKLSRDFSPIYVTTDICNSFQHKHTYTHISTK